MSDYSIFYELLLLVVPLIGLISSQIFTNVASDEWFSNINFYLPDIINKGYGLYLATYIYLAAGLALVIIYGMTRDNTSIRVDSIYKINNTNKGGINAEYAKLILWLLPLGFLLNYISIPIMFSVENLIVPCVLNVFVFICFIILLFFFFRISNIAALLFLPITIYVLYQAIFFGSGGENQESKVFYSNPEPSVYNNTV